MPVGVLTEDGFDATTIDEATALLGDAELEEAAAAIRAHEEDLDGDGDTDLLLFFRMPELVRGGAIDGNSTELTLTGETVDDREFAGADAVDVVPGSSKGKSKP